MHKLSNCDISGSLGYDRAVGGGILPWGTHRNFLLNGFERVGRNNISRKCLHINNVEKNHGRLTEQCFFAFFDAIKYPLAMLNNLLC